MAATKLLCIDPGANAGWAYFVGPDLQACGLSKASGKTVHARVVQHMGNLVDWYVAADCVLVERGVYQGRSGGKSGRNMTPSQLADFNCMAGQLAGWKGQLVTARQWKGMVPKEIHQPRVLAGLTAAERQVLVAARVAPSLENNVVDAIGLGLAWLGRVGAIAKVDTCAKGKKRRRTARSKV